jgi:signal peptidase II
MNQKVVTAGWLLSGILIVDVLTKKWALDALSHGLTLHAFGGFLPLTLTYNRGVAFGLDVGGFRWLIITGSVLVMCALGVLLSQARAQDQGRVAAIAAVMAGALGNLIDRVRWERGVVDFIGPFNLGFAQFPIFNVADMAITVGAAALALSLWLEEREVDREAAPVEATSTDPA